MPTYELEGYNDVLGFTTLVQPATKEIKLYITFNQLSTSVINHGNIHDARQWDLLFLTKSNNENLWKKLAYLPIQVCAEVTGRTRDPQVRKRAKRSGMVSSSEKKRAIWKCNMQLRKITIHDLQQEIVLKQNIINQQQNIISKVKNILNVDTLILLQNINMLEANSEFQLSEKIVQWRT